MSRDVLDEILSAALREKAIGPDGLADFAAGLRERARIILGERLRPWQDRVDTLEKENAWRADSILGLTAENERLTDENGRLKDENLRLKEETERMRGEWRTASEAHDRLLQHHRGVVRGAAESLLAVAELPVWKRRQARARLADIAAALRRDTA